MAIARRNSRGAVPLMRLNNDPVSFGLVASLCKPSVQSSRRMAMQSYAPSSKEVAPRLSSFLGEVGDHVILKRLQSISFPEVTG